MTKREGDRDQCGRAACAGRGRRFIGLGAVLSEGDQWCSIGHTQVKYVTKP
jgi:hypothetical protein